MAEVAEVRAGTPVRRVAASDEVRRLEKCVARMEQRYEVGSDQMAQELRAGTQKETREISKWMTEYYLLTRLRQIQAHGPVTG